MMLQRTFALFVLLLLPSLGFAGQQQSKPLTNEDVVNMVAGGLDESLVISAIQANEENFDVSSNALLALKQAKVSDKVLQAMLAAEGKKRNPLPASSESKQPDTNPQAMAINPASFNPMMGQAAAAQAMAMQMMASRGMSPQMMAQISAMQRARSGMGMFPSAAMGSQAGEMDARQLPRVSLITGDSKEAVNRSITQISKTEVKGGQGGASMAPMGSMAALGMRAGMGGGLSGLSMLGGLGGAALRFAPLAAGPGMILAAPAMSLATGLLGGGLAHHSSAPKATYVWALPGAHSAYAMATSKPRFEIEFGEIVGLDPDAYEPALVKLTQTKDNWRLVGATKDTFDKHGNEKQSPITEDRTQIKTTAMGRGHVVIEATSPLAPGEYGVVLHPIKEQKTAASMGAGLTAGQTIFYSVWDFSVPAGSSDATRAELH
jgi:hypothetical protein